MRTACMPTNPDRVLIIGGGPAGMAAALFALRQGADVLLLERNEKLGKKLYITGKGRCNVTNAASGEELLDSYPRNRRFLYAALRFLPPEGLREVLRGLNCDTIVERGGRVFPVSQKASDVTRALTRGLSGAEVRLGVRVKAVSKTPGGGFSVLTEGGESLQARSVIIATGGLSYPVTGSTGDGYALARTLGHSVTDTFPSLVPYETADDWSRPLTGLSLKNVVLEAARGKKTLFSQQGEMLFTHFGISGPLVLSLSSHLAGLDAGAVDCFIDLKPAVTAEQLDLRLSGMLREDGRKQLSGLLPQLMPSSLAAVFPAVCRVDGTRQASQVSAAERRRMTACLKHLPLRLTGPRPFSEAVITRGGVQVKEVDPSTMQSKLVPGLYFAGEVLDVDGYTGGFNLQAAFATGALAGRSAAGGPGQTME